MYTIYGHMYLQIVCRMQTTVSKFLYGICSYVLGSCWVCTAAEPANDECLSPPAAEPASVDGMAAEPANVYL